MDNVLQRDLSSNCDCAFLVGRALWVRSRPTRPTYAAGAATAGVGSATFNRAHILRAPRLLVALRITALLPVLSCN